MTSKQRVVVDTNLWISYLIKTESPTGRVVDYLLQHHWVLISEDTLLELTGKISSPRLRKYFSIAEGLQLVLLLEQVGEFIDIRTSVQDCRDPKDDKFLALALDGEADCIITGDDDLLVLNPYHGIPIMNAREYKAMARN